MPEPTQAALRAATAIEGDQWTNYLRESERMALAILIDRETRLPEAQREITDLRARVERLREALEPFASVGELADDAVFVDNLVSLIALSSLRQAAQVWKERK